MLIDKSKKKEIVKTTSDEYINDNYEELGNTNHKPKITTSTKEIQGLIKKKDKQSSKFINIRVDSETHKKIKALQLIYKSGTMNDVLCDLINDKFNNMSEEEKNKYDMIIELS